MSDVDDDPLIGSVLAERYRVESLIGIGAMGRVYRAEHVRMRKVVALKILHPQLTRIPDMVQRFEQEAQAAARIQHPHVAAAIDFGKLPDGSVYLALEYIEGVALSHWIKEGPIEVRRALRIVGQVASALELAHAEGIVHRDLKPDNLLLQDGTDGDFVKVLDFGIAKLSAQAQDTDKPLTLAGVVYGTPEYMAPEQALAQEVDGRADLYALGVMFFEMLTGRRPYVGPVAGLLGQQLSQPVPRMHDVARVKVPAAVEQLVVELLSTDPKRRPESASTVRQQIESLELAWDEGRLSGYRGSGALLSATLDEVTDRFQSVAQGLPEPVKEAVQSRTSRMTLISLLFAALGVGGVLFFMRSLEGQTAAPSLPLETPPSPVTDEPEQEPELGRRLELARQEGLSELEVLAKEFPAEGIVQAELSLEYAKTRKFKEALEAARSALALDPQLNEHPKIAGALFRATQSPLVRAACFRLLRGAMGAAGVSIIYDLAHTEDVHARVRAEARLLLKKEEVQQAMPPSVRLLVNLEKAKTCEDLRPLVEQAALVGDKRALPFLEDLKATVGCGPRKQGDCYPCLRQTDALEKSIAQLAQRTTLGASSNEVGTPTSDKASSDQE